MIGIKLLKMSAYGVEGTREIAGMSVEHGPEKTESILDKLFKSHLGQVLLA
jgi:hypothetical protein